MKRRMIRQKISFEFLEKLLRGDLKEIAETNAPKDLEVVSISGKSDDFFNGCFEVFLTSKTFDEVSEGTIIPLTEPFWYRTKRIEESG